MGAPRFRGREWAVLASFLAAIVERQVGVVVAGQPLSSALSWALRKSVKRQSACSRSFHRKKPELLLSRFFSDTRYASWGVCLQARLDVLGGMCPKGRVTYVTKADLTRPNKKWEASSCAAFLLRV